MDENLPMIKKQHGLQRILRIEGNPVHRVHVACPPPSALARRREGELDVFVAGGFAALVHVQQPEGVGRIDTHQDVVAAVKSQPQHPVRRESMTSKAREGGGEARRREGERYGGRG